MALNVGSIFSDFMLNSNPFEKGMQRVQEVQARALGDMARRADASSSTLTGLRSKIESMTAELDKTRIGTKHFENLKRRIAETRDELSKAEGGAKGFSGVMSGIGGGAALAGITATIGKMAQLGMRAEQNATSFEVFLGSAEKANAVLAELNKFANVTPFSNEEVIQAGRSLLAFGVEAKDLTSTLTRIGDIASAVNIPFNEMAQIYGKMRVQGKLQMEDINQLQGRGINILGELAKMYGVNEAAVREMVTAGSIGFQDMDAAMKKMTGTGGIFNGMMDKQATTGAGLMSTLQGSIESLGAELGAFLVQSGKPLIQWLIEFVDWFRSGIQTLRDFGEEYPVLANIGSGLGTLTLAAGGLGVAFMALNNSLLTALFPSLAKLGPMIAANAAAFAPLLAAIAGFTVGYKLAEGLNDKFVQSGREMARAVTSQSDAFLKAAQTVKELGSKTNLTAAEQKKLKEASDMLESSLRKHGQAVDFANLSYDKQIKLIRQLAAEEIRNLNTAMRDLATQMERNNRNFASSFLNQLTGENARIEGQMESLEQRSRDLAAAAEQRQEEARRRQAAGNSNLPPLQLKTVIDFDAWNAMIRRAKSEKMTVRIGIEEARVGTEESPLMKLIREGKQRGYLVNTQLKTEIMDPAEFEKAQTALKKIQALPEKARRDVDLNVRSALTGELTSQSTIDRILRENQGTTKQTAEFTIDPQLLERDPKARQFFEDFMAATRANETLLVNGKLNIEGESKKEENWGAIEPIRQMTQELGALSDQVSSTGMSFESFTGILQSVITGVTGVIQSVGALAKSYADAFSRLTEVAQQKFARKFEIGSYFVDLFQRYEQQKMQEQIDLVRDTEDAKIREVERGAAMRKVILDKEFEDRKGQLEQQKLAEMEALRLDYEAKLAKLHAESADKEQAMIADDLMAADFKAAKEALEKEHADRLAQLATEINGKKETDKKASDDKITLLEKEKNDKIDALEKDKTAKDKANKKQQAQLKWLFESFTMEMGKQAQIQQLKVQGITGAAQAMAGAMAALAPIPFVGPFLGMAMGAKLASMIMSATNTAVGLVSHQFVLPSPEALGLATGGVLRGPGGPTDDLIHARLSNREAVIDAGRTTRLLGAADNITKIAANADRIGPSNAPIYFHEGAIQFFGVGDLDETKMAIYGRRMAQVVGRYR